MHQDALTSAWLMVVPACRSTGLHRLCVLYQHGHWELQLCTMSCLPVISSTYCHGLGILLYVNPVLLPV